MFRSIKLLLSVCVICGVLSLVIFYLYTTHYNTSRILLINFKTNTARTRKGVSTKGNWNFSTTTKTLLGEDIMVVTLPVTRAPTTSHKPVASSTLPVVTKKSSGYSGQNGVDSIDDLIKNSQENIRKRSHSDGNEPEPSMAPHNEKKVSPMKASTIKLASSGDITSNVMPTTSRGLEKNTPTSETNSEEEDVELCPVKPQSLIGPVFVNQRIPKMDDLKKHFSQDFGGWVMKGGTWKPTHCKARVKMALIIPFRKRDEQLAIFVRHMHPMLKRQEIDYRIIVVEQSGSTPFNRAILFNVGFKEALKFDDYNCFVFHDVDLIPEDDRNLYTCPTSPRHMSVAVDKFNYRLPYITIFGGAGSFLRKDFEEINGFSNMFWGWGGEDDDLYQRVISKGHHLSRPALQIGRYKMIKINHHQSSNADPNRHDLLQNSAVRMAIDGLNSLKYQLLDVEERHLYTLIKVHVDKSLLS